MATWSDSPTAQAMRDLIQQVTRTMLATERPQVRYATVVTLDRTNRKATVTYIGETSTATVAMGSVQPANTGQVVRIGGPMGDRYIEDVLGSAYFATGTLLLPDGALATPALAFVNDPNMGVYRTGTDAMALVTDGAAAIKIGSTQKIVMDGATAPQLTVGVAGGGAATIMMPNTGSGGIGLPAANPSARSGGTKIVLYQDMGLAGRADYAFGINGSTLWSSVPSSSERFEWYASTTIVGKLDGAGVLSIAPGSGVGGATGTGQVNAAAFNLDGYKNWDTGGYDASGGGAAIVNDNGSYQALMLLGNRSAGGSRVIKMYDNVTAAGTITGTRLISTQATGTAPLSVTSTTMVDNLNAEFVGGASKPDNITTTSFTARTTSGSGITAAMATLTLPAQTSAGRWFFMLKFILSNTVAGDAFDVGVSADGGTSYAALTRVKQDSGVSVYCHGSIAVSAGVGDTITAHMNRQAGTGTGTNGTGDSRFHSFEAWFIPN